MASIAVTGQEMDEGLEEMWTDSTQGVSAIDPATENWKIQTLPLARIKKIMKSEEFILQELEKEKQQKAAEEGQTETEKSNVKFMISGEAPVLMSKACELLIKDLSFRAWRHTERNRRRTLQRQDLHAAVGESEVYDFLIDIVPRVTTAKTSVNNTTAEAAAAMAPPIPGLPPMGGIAGIPVPQPMTAAPGVGQPMATMMDTNMMQQMQQQHLHQQTQQNQQQQTQQQLSMVHQYPPEQQQPQQQQQYQSYMAMPPVNSTDVNQGTGQVLQAHQQHWMTQPPVPNAANAPQP